MLFQLLNETPPSPEQPQPIKTVMETESTEKECTHLGPPTAKNISIQVRMKTAMRSQPSQCFPPEKKDTGIQCLLLDDKIETSTPIHSPDVSFSEEDELPDDEYHPSNLSLEEYEEEMEVPDTHRA